MIVHQKPNQVGVKLGKNLLESTADAVSDILILTDLQGIIIRRNKAAHHRFHAIYGEILGRNIDGFFQETLAACSKTVKSSTAPIRLEGEICFSKIEGWFEISAFPVYLEGELYGYVHTIKDIPAVNDGDEFIILLPDTGDITALDVAENLHKTVASTPINTYRGLISITISLGLATIMNSCT